MTMTTTTTMTHSNTELVDGCSWLPNRINVVPFGTVGNHYVGAPYLPSKFVDSLDEARTVKVSMLHAGARFVEIYDTVEGEFFA